MQDFSLLEWWWLWWWGCGGGGGHGGGCGSGLKELMEELLCFQLSPTHIAHTFTMEYSCIFFNFCCISEVKFLLFA